MEHHSFGLKIKAVDEAGRFSGIGAVYGNVDLGGDKILPGAFRKSLEGAKQLPLLWQHNPSDPIGTVKVSDGEQGLMVDGQLLLSDPTAQKAYQFMKAGVIKGLSIGYDTEKAAYVDGVRELRELKLHELSVVTFPMNPSATILGVKQMSDEDRSKRVKSIDSHRKAIDRHQRGMREDLKALFDGFDDGDTADDQELLEDEGGDMADQDSKFIMGELQKMLVMTKG